MSKFRFKCDTHRLLIRFGKMPLNNLKWLLNQLQLNFSVVSSVSYRFFDRWSESNVFWSYKLFRGQFNETNYLGDNSIKQNHSVDNSMDHDLYSFEREFIISTQVVLVKLYIKIGQSFLGLMWSNIKMITLTCVVVTVNIKLLKTPSFYSIKRC
jgi:hypothetical protein